jgi:glutamyl-tRNA(Gln) amidotransferase subunit E
MKKKFSASRNYNNTKKAIGFVLRNDATEADYKRIGFMSGLEVHQQLKTKKKLFCRCPAGVYHNNKNFDAEIIRHMRPTLSELGEYDGTALMEFRTKKEITYQINNKTACTYEIDDTPPFPIDKEALEIALEITLLSKFNVVGEVHITRKQYLDGSIPTGFQRTAILGVEGVIQLKSKKVRLIQLSIEEDSCREISDIGHKRVYKTDRLGMPLIETVTYPDMDTPDLLMEAANYIRFLNRSSGKVRIGIGAGREDVNVSCRGGTRVEIKGVSHNKWIPKLSHNEAFRQWALLNIRKILKEKVSKTKEWKITYKNFDPQAYGINVSYLTEAREKNEEIIAINLPEFQGILSHFMQPGKMFAHEIEDRIKVIACIEKPNMLHSEQLKPELPASKLKLIKDLLKSDEGDAQIIIWGPAEDIKTALETIEERCKMAFEGVPNETRKPFEDGTTIFERVLPGADRMYPDTDSPPIPLANDYIDRLSKDMPEDIVDRYKQLKDWEIPEDTYTYILRNNLVPVIEKIVNTLGFNPKFIGTFFGHKLKNIEGKYQKHPEFSYEKIYGLFKFLKNEEIDCSIAKKMAPVIYEHPIMDFNSVLTSIKFKKRSKVALLAPVDFLIEKFKEIKISKRDDVTVEWLMGELHNHALGNIPFKTLRAEIEKINNELNTPSAKI